MRRGGGRWEAEAPMGGRPDLGEVACSAGGGGAGVCAASECSGQASPSPGLGVGLHAD